MTNAIVCLTRGYTDPKKYETLIKRNEAIKHFFGTRYPLLIFHEGNITEIDQRFIRGETHDKAPANSLQFHNIADRWQGGYEGMCRFYAWDIWEVCQYYDYILRVDEDTHLLEVSQDPFQHIGDNVYLKSVFFAESHSETNATLPDILEQLTGVKKEEFYNDKFVYTNVSLSSVRFWRQGIVGEILKQVALSSEQKRNRWGDLPILGSLLNIYAKNRVGTLTGMKYSHLSHGNVIICQ